MRESKNTELSELFDHISDGVVEVLTLDWHFPEPCEAWLVKAPRVDPASRECAAHDKLLDFRELSVQHLDQVDRPQSSGDVF